jgi:carboxyl-terminal processing protease
MWIRHSWIFASLVILTIASMGDRAGAQLGIPQTAPEVAPPSESPDAAEEPKQNGTQKTGPDANGPDATETGKARDTADLQPALEATEADDEAYFELLKLFADTLDQVERNYVKEVSRRELMEAAIQGVLAKLDQYSDYIPPEQLDNFRTGVESEFGGIGVRVGLLDGKLVVITPLIGTPAYRAGILAGDQIVEIAGKSTEGMSLEDAIVNMKGPIGTDIQLTVRQNAESEPRPLTLKRELVRLETVFGDHREVDDRWNFWLDEQKKIGYVRITSFSRHTFEDLKAAVETLVKNNAVGLVIDLRNNPGGLLTSAIEVADLFLSEGIIVKTAGRNVAERPFRATEPGTVQDLKLAILVNRATASASEIVAACLQDHKRAIVVGERTWGKGSVQNIIELEGGKSALKLTTAGYQRPSGKNIHRFEGATEEDDWGVRPNEGLEVKLSASEIRQLVGFQRDSEALRSRAGGERVLPQRFVDSQLQAAVDQLTK